MPPMYDAYMGGTQAYMGGTQARLQPRLDSLLSYLARHGQHVSNLHLLALEPPPTTPQTLLH